jgi:hypothetical protein
MKNKLGIVVVVFLFFCACNTKGLKYNSQEVPNDFVGLAPLPADSGYQIHIPAFPIPANFEREFFLRKDLGNPQEIFINSFRVKSRPGTHHFIAYGIKDKGNPLPPKDIMTDQNNLDGTFNMFSALDFSTYLIGSPSDDYTFALPPGYGIRVEANSMINCNQHYFNKTNATRFGETYLNMYTIPKAQVTTILENAELDGSEKLILPPDKTLTITTEKIFTKRTQVFIMLPHYHKLGKFFEVQFAGGSRNGEVLLQSQDYVHPTEGIFTNTPLIFEPGQGLRTVVTWNNTTNRTIKYGVTSEDEMNILFYYYKEL